MARHARRRWWRYLVPTPLFIIFLVLYVIVHHGLIFHQNPASLHVPPSVSTPAHHPAPIPQAPHRAAQPRAQPRAPVRYTVQQDDTLWDIAKAHCGNPLAWPRIWHASKIMNPDLIYPKEMLTLTCLIRGQK